MSLETIFEDESMSKTQETLNYHLLSLRDTSSIFTFLSLSFSRSIES